MKNILIISEGKIKARRVWLLSALALILALLIFGQLAMAQNVSVEPAIDDSLLPVESLKEYLSEKYVIREINSYLRPIPYGESRRLLDIRGDLTPKGVKTSDEIRPEHARAVSKAFLAEESATLFGITNLEEIREYNISTDLDQPGWTGIYYHRYIGDLPLDGTLIHIQITPDNRIDLVTGYLVPAPPELYQAVKEQTITEDDALKIVMDDLESNGIYLLNMHSMIKKIAVSSSPYIIWTVNVSSRGQGRWRYRIDAFAGEILSRD